MEFLNTNLDWDRQGAAENFLHWLPFQNLTKYVFYGESLLSLSWEFFTILLYIGPIQSKLCEHVHKQNNKFH